MTIVRLSILLVLASGLGLVAFQNQQPLVLTFLGTKTIALPLSFWLIAALLLGGTTTALFSWLLNFHRGSDDPSPPARTPQRSPNEVSNPLQALKFQGIKFPRFSWLKRSRAAYGSSDDAAAWDDDDWGDRSVRTRSKRHPDWDAADPINPPRSAPPNQRPRQADSVVDAEFRVIVPPSRNLEEDDA
jgi:hypothetical protein